MQSIDILIFWSIAILGECKKNVFKVAKFMRDDISHSENLLGCIENHLENWSIWEGPEGLNSENLISIYKHLFISVIHETHLKMVK